MAVRICRARPPTIARSPVKTSPPRSIPVRHAATKRILAYEFVTIPSWEVLHKHFTNRVSTQAITEDPYLEHAFVPSVLENFSGRKMLYGMIKVELTLMVWGYKDLDLPKEVCDLIIGNISESISESSRLYEAPIKNPIKYLSQAAEESKPDFNLNKV